MIRGGTTTFVDMYFYPDTIAKVVENCGLRAVIASPSIDYPSPGFKGWDDSFKAAVNFVGRWHNKNERITPAFAPHSAYTVSPEHLKQVMILIDWGRMKKELRKNTSITHCHVLNTLATRLTVKESCSTLVYTKVSIYVKSIIY